MIRSTLVAVSLAMAFSAPAFASGLTAEQSVDKVVTTTNETGELIRTFVTAERLTPGDELRYALTYENQADEAASNIVLVMPVPDEVEFIESSATATGAAVEYSADGGSTFADRQALTVMVGDTARAALPEDITHIRWTFIEAVAPDATGAVTYRARLK